LKAEIAISKMYRRIKKKPPKTFVWCKSPATALMALHVLKQSINEPALKADLCSDLWAALGSSLGDSLRDSLWDSLRDSIGDGLLYSTGDSLRHSIGDSLRYSIGDSLRNSLGNGRPFDRSAWDTVGPGLG